MGRRSVDGQIRQPPPVSRTGVAFVLVCVCVCVIYACGHGIRLSAKPIRISDVYLIHLNKDVLARVSRMLSKRVIFECVLCLFFVVLGVIAVSNRMKTNVLMDVAQ